MQGKHYLFLAACFAGGWVLNNLAFGQSAFQITAPASSS
jgi:hypothetical protein